MNGPHTSIPLGSISGSRRVLHPKSVKSPLHRAAEVMQQESISLRTIARRMNISTEQARNELNPEQDLRLSDLYRWRSALRVPTIDLLVHPGSGLSDSIQQRAKLLKMMKTVKSLQEESNSEAITRLAQRLEKQLTEIMPELKEVSSWPLVGKRRRREELGALADNILPDSFFGKSSGADSREPGVHE